MTDDAIRKAILLQISARGDGKTICPSEVARVLASHEDAWRALMPQVRAVAATLQTEGLVQATQKGRPVDPVTATGPIRLGSPA